VLVGVNSPRPWTFIVRPDPDPWPLAMIMAPVLIIKNSIANVMIYKISNLVDPFRLTDEIKPNYSVRDMLSHASQILEYFLRPKKKKLEKCSNPKPERRHGPPTAWGRPAPCEGPHPLLVPLPNGASATRDELGSFGVEDKAQSGSCGSIHREWPRCRNALTLMYL
jgi:hypothetical protein